jgi:hypothetical protein
MRLITHFRIDSVNSDLAVETVRGSGRIRRDGVDGDIGEIRERGERKRGGTGSSTLE